MILKLFIISDSGVSSIDPVIPTPALFINISMRECLSIIFFTTDLMEFLSETSNFNKGKLNFEEIYLGFLLVPYTIYFFSKRKFAIDFPMPDDAPVTKTIFSI